MKRIFTLLLALTWAFLNVHSQVVPDHYLRHLDPNAPRDLVSTLSKSNCYHYMLHDSIHVLYESGKDEKGLSTLLRWKAGLEAIGDTLGLDYAVVLTDLGLAMLQLGDLDQADRLWSHVVYGKTWDASVGPMLIGMVGLRKVSADVLRGNYKSAALSQRHSEELQGWDEHFGSSYEYDQDELKIDEGDSVRIVEGVAQLEQGYLGMQAMVAQIPNPNMLRFLEYLGVQLENMKLQLELTRGKKVDLANLLSLESKIQALQVPAGIPISAQMELAKVTLNAGYPYAAIGMCRRGRAWLQRYCAQPRQTHFEMSGFLLIGFMECEATALRKLGRPEAAVSLLMDFDNQYAAAMRHAPGGGGAPSQLLLHRLILAGHLISDHLARGPEGHAATIIAGRELMRMYGDYHRKLGAEERLWLNRTMANILDAALSAVTEVSQEATSTERQRLATLEGLAWAEGLKGRILQADWVRAQGAPLLPDSTRQHLAMLSQRLQWVQQGRYLPGAPVAQLAAEESRLESEIEAISASSAPFSFLSSAPDLKRISAMQSSLAIDEALLYFFHFRDHLYRFVVDRHTAKISRMDLPPSARAGQSTSAALAARIAGLHAPMLPVAKYHSEATALREFLWPWNSPAEAPKVVHTFPDGPLWGLPFGALPYGNESAVSFQSMDYLLRYHSITVWPCLQQWWVQRGLPLQRHQPELKWIAPQYAGRMGCDSLAPLTRIDSAVQAIAGRYAGEFLIGPEANERNASLVMQGRGVLAISGHSLLAVQDPDSNCVALTATCLPDLGNDGRLAAWEVAHVAGPQELVMLWGCNTGKGQIVPGEGMLSIGRSFVATGSHAVLMSQWAQEEGPTVRIMIAYLEGLQAGLGRGEALRQAQLQYLEQAGPLDAEPCRWAGWMLLGDDRPLSQPIALRSQNLGAWALGIGIAGMLAFAVTRRRRKHR